MACPSCFRSGLGPELCGVCSEALPPINVLPVGTTLKDGSFVVGKVLGRGGFGITYLAWDFAADRPVAIKEYFPTDFAHRAREGDSVRYSKTAAHPFEAARSKFVEEATKLRELRLPDGGKHANIVEVYDCFGENETDYIVMEYLGDRDFETWLSKRPNNRTSWEQAYRILGAVMDGLAFLHRCRPELLHLDVAADNICITDDGQVKLIDFGSARFSLKQSQQTRTKSISVKEGYSPIEQLYGASSCGVAADIYALGATFYRAVTGFLPPNATYRQTSVNENMADPLQWPSSSGIPLPRHAEEAIIRALAIRARDRFGAINDFQDALDGKQTATVMGKDSRASQESNNGSIVSDQIFSTQANMHQGRIQTMKTALGPWRTTFLILTGIGALICFLWSARLFTTNDRFGSAILLALGIILMFWCRWLFQGRRDRPA